MFADAPFNQPIGGWNTEAVRNMSSMFRGDTAFDQPIGTWNTEAVTNMSYMFDGATAFNQPIGTWNTGAVTNMSLVFYGATAFNQPIGAWKTGAVTDMSYMFDGAHAFKIMEMLLHPGLTYPNLFASCPPFQIDGNFGGPAGIAEMLLQSQNNEIQFLPALPSAWPNGSVKGMRARGGFEVDFAWQDGKLTSATVSSVTGKVAHLRYGSVTREINLKPGGSFLWDGK